MAVRAPKPTVATELSTLPHNQTINFEPNVRAATFSVILSDYDNVGGEIDVDYINTDVISQMSHTAAGSPYIASVWPGLSSELCGFVLPLLPLFLISSPPPPLPPNVFPKQHVIRTL